MRTRKSSRLRSKGKRPGKQLESDVKDYLDEAMTLPGSWYHRFPDAQQ